MIRTRFAPSPTGFMHMGNLRSALYPWVFARRHQGAFILRIEDTDQERSTAAAVEVILQSLQWLGIHIDEGPYFQTHRLQRYQEVLQQLLTSGHAYYCYCSTEELALMREQQIQNKQKPRYDGRWRPETGKTLAKPPSAVQPVIRFKTPLRGEIAWDDQVKGYVRFDNQELDDLIIARVDGSPTYNFCVVVDDMDMRITHVIRGDDHVNNTPRQLHIFNALATKPPQFAHLPTVLNAQGAKLSKRSGAKSVLQYRDEGFLPQAIINYLARLGWSHGNEEFFSVEQLIQWFDLTHLGNSAAQFDEDKLLWLNAQHLRAAPLDALMHNLKDFFQSQNYVWNNENDWSALVDLLRARCQTLKELTQQLLYFFTPPTNTPIDSSQWLTPLHLRRVQSLVESLQCLAKPWEILTIKQCFQSFLQQHAIKFPEMAMPIRLLLCSQTQTPALDVLLVSLGAEWTLKRLTKRLAEHGYA